MMSGTRTLIREIASIVKSNVQHPDLRGALRDQFSSGPVPLGFAPLGGLTGHPPSHRHVSPGNPCVWGSLGCGRLWGGESKPPGTWSLAISLAMQPQASYQPLLSLSFLVCEMGIMITEFKESVHKGTRQISAPLLYPPYGTSVYSDCASVL